MILDSTLPKRNFEMFRSGVRRNKMTINMFLSLLGRSVSTYGFSMFFFLSVSDVIDSTHGFTPYISLYFLIKISKYNFNLSTEKH